MNVKAAKIATGSIAGIFLVLAAMVLIAVGIKAILDSTHPALWFSGLGVGVLWTLIYQASKEDIERDERLRRKVREWN